MKSNLGIIIPTRNVEKTIGRVLEDFTDNTLNQINEILIIDNGSTDATLQTIQKALESRPLLRDKLRMLLNKENKGYGSSIKIGFDYFIKNGKTHVAIVHSDRQGNAEEIICNFLAEYRADPSLELIIACRFLPKSNVKKYSTIRKLGNYLFNFLTYLSTGYKMPDSGSAIILASTEKLKLIPYSEFSSNWHFHPQLNISFYSMKDLKIKEVPLDWEDSKGKSQLNIYSYGFKLLNLLIRYRFSGQLLESRNPHNGVNLRCLRKRQS